MIVPIGRWVLRTACEPAAAWRERRALGIAVNLSARQLADEHLEADLESALALSGLDPAAVTLEVGEASLVRDEAAAVAVLGSLRRQGVRIAIDDYGSGRFPLERLAALPVDAIKIDRAFVADPDSRLLVRMVVKLGRVLGLETLGEGIEDAAQLRALQALECDSGQGFHLAVPLDPERIGALIDERAARRDAPAAAA